MLTPKVFSSIIKSVKIGRLRLLILAVLTTITLAIHFNRLLFENVIGHSHFIHAVHARFCYIPIVLGALWFGLRGGLMVAGLVSLATALYIIVKPVIEPHDLLNEFTETFFYLVLGGLAGFFLDRERSLQKRKDEIEQKLRQAEKLSLLGQMAASIAHEIRNPLGSIKGAAQIVNDRSSTENERLEFGSIIEKEADRLDRVVRDFLSHVRPSAYRLTEVDVPQILENVRRQLQFQADRQNVKIHLNAEKIPTVMADADKLHQVLLNVVLNAIQAMPGGGRIDLNCFAAGDGSPDNLQIEIIDSGPGIAETDQDRIFEPFYSTRSQGTGLGLATARAIVNEHGGTIKVESKVGMGSKFVISLPGEVGHASLPRRGETQPEKHGHEN